MESKFKQYTGPKTVKAMFMGAGEAKRCGANLTDEVVKKNLGNDGYLVEYPDGYRSWSPAKQFQAAYRISETDLDRLHIELAELKERILKATDALYSETPVHLARRSLLDAQVRAMRSYADVLLERIKLEAQVNNFDQQLASYVSCAPKIAEHKVAEGGEQ